MYLPKLEPVSGRLLGLKMVVLQSRRFRLNRASTSDVHWLLNALNKICIPYGTRVTMEPALDQGRIKIWLDGEKVKGGYALMRIRTKPERWLLVKINDAEADIRRDLTKTEPRSVLSRKTVEEIKKSAGKPPGRKKVA